jgi:uncharacterized protein (DUF433 family)
MWEGEAYGIHFPSKRGAEMVLAYVDGNPDRPLGLGFVPNAGQNFVSEGNELPIDAEVDTVESEAKAKDVKVDTGEVEPWEDEERLTVKDIAERLKKIEAKQGYEAARYYATNCIDYWKVNLLAKRYVEEEDEDKKEEEKDNDPCLMPSRFMLLYGADDEGLSGQGNLDDYPDKFDDEEDVKISVAELRKGLRELGFKINEEGPFNLPVYHAFLQYHWDKGRVRLCGVYAEKDDAGKTMDAVADKYGMVTWKTIEDNYNCKADHDRIQEDLNTEYGDELLREKGADPVKFRPGVAYHYLWVPFHVTLLAQGNDNSDKNPVSDASPDPYGRKVSLFKFDSPASSEHQEERKIVVLMALWYNQYKFQEGGRTVKGQVDIKDKNNVFTKALYNDIKSLEDTFKKMGIDLKVEPEQFGAGEQKKLGMFIIGKADVRAVIGHSRKDVDYLMNRVDMDIGDKASQLDLYYLNQQLNDIDKYAVIDACGLKNTLNKYSNLKPLAPKFYEGNELDVKGSAGVFDYIKKEASDIAKKKWGIEIQ